MANEVKFYDVIVHWRDEPELEGMSTTVAVDPDWADKEDDESVFFYFQTEEEYRDALINGTEEFTMVEAS